jgi:hypothetical protein
MGTPLRFGELLDRPFSAKGPGARPHDHLGTIPYILSWNFHHVRCQSACPTPGCGVWCWCVLNLIPILEQLINGTFGVQSSVRLSSWRFYFDLKTRPHAQALACSSVHL